MNEPVTSVPRLTLAGARRAVEAAQARAAELDVAVVITVTDPSADPLMTIRMDGAPKISLGVASDKAWTVACFGKPSHWWADAVSADEELARLSDGRPLLAVAGGIPIEVEDRLAGVIAVSGATSAQDRDIAETGAAAVRSHE